MSNRKNADDRFDAMVREVREVREAGEAISALHDAHDEREAKVLALVGEALRAHASIGYIASMDAAEKLIAEIDALRGPEYISYMTFTPSRF